MSRIHGNTISLGRIDGSGSLLEMTPEQRATHLYVCGSTGTGKSKMLEHLIRQDIVQWHDSKCGLLLLDPHGSLYDSLMKWAAWNEDVLKGVPIVPIDLRQKDWSIAYNLMRPREQADPSVIIGNFVQAMAYVWARRARTRLLFFNALARMCFGLCMKRSSLSWKRSICSTAPADLCGRK